MLQVSTEVRGCGRILCCFVDLDFMRPDVSCWAAAISTTASLFLASKGLFRFGKFLPHVGSPLRSPNMPSCGVSFQQDSLTPARGCALPHQPLRPLHAISCVLSGRQAVIALALGTRLHFVAFFRGAMSSHTQSRPRPGF